MDQTQDIEFKYADIQDCSACSADSLQLVFDFGTVPLAGYFPRPGQTVLPLIPMRLYYCGKCSLYQISPDISDDYLFQDYRYISSVGMQSHFDKMADWFIETQNPSSDCRIVEFGCNDGPFLQALTERGLSPIGVDPARNIVELARGKGLKVIEDFFNIDAIAQHSELRDLDYIFSSNSFAHISDIRSIAEAVSKGLKVGGSFIVEVQGIEQMYDKKAFDFIYHEHKYYYSIESMSNLLMPLNLILVESNEVESHGGSLRLIFRKSAENDTKPMLEAVSEWKSTMMSPKNLAAAIDEYIRDLEILDLEVQRFAADGKRIAAFGASGRANMLLGKLPKTRSVLEFVVDESPERVGRLMAQNNIGIISLEEFKTKEIDVLIILAWNFAEVILAKLPVKNYQVIIPLPKIKKIIN